MQLMRRNNELTPVQSDLVSWQRLWLPLDSQEINRRHAAGFLESWEDVFGIRSSDGPRRLDELLGLRCLILCGEPGMGKSKALELQRHQIEQAARRQGEIYWRSFREALSPEHLIEDLKSSHQWKHWLDGG